MPVGERDELEIFEKFTFCFRPDNVVDDAINASFVKKFQRNFKERSV